MRKTGRVFRRKAMICNGSCSEDDEYQKTIFAELNMAKSFQILPFKSTSLAKLLVYLK